MTGHSARPSVPCRYISGTPLPPRRRLSLQPLISMVCVTNAISHLLHDDRAAISVRSLSPFGERVGVRGVTAYRATLTPHPSPLTPPLSLWERERTEFADKSSAQTTGGRS